LTVPVLPAVKSALTLDGPKMRHYRRAEQQFAEDICAENNQIVFDYKIPVANKADF
jgi:hypothetical protein